ncbi:MAG: nucleotidyltransferase [Bacteroidota bacterium]
MDIPNYFQEFLKEIRLTQNMRDDLLKGHTTLRERLHSDEHLTPIIVDSFLQGSYKRSTAVRPKGDKRADVDIVVVTKIKRSEYPDPEKAMNLFIPFLEKYYTGKYKIQGRSFGIELSYVDMDLVITSAPSEEEENIYKSYSVTTSDTVEEATDWRLIKSWVPNTMRSPLEQKAIKEAIQKEKEWQTEPLWIPDREAKVWQETHPLEQIKWTSQKNKRCNGHFVNIVKAIKWWELINHENLRPKGYPLEHLLGDCCPDSINSIAAGVTAVFENITTKYAMYALSKSKPFMQDRGLPAHDVFARITEEEFEIFWTVATKAAQIAREALQSTDEVESSFKWRELFGEKFPKATNNDNKETIQEFTKNSALPIIRSNPSKPWSF